MPASIPSPSSSWNNGGGDTNAPRVLSSPNPSIADIISKKKKRKSQRIEQQEALECEGSSVLGSLVESAISKYHITQDDLSLVDQVLTEPIVTTYPSEIKMPNKQKITAPIRIFAEKSPRDSSLSAPSTPAPKGPNHSSSPIKTPSCKNTSPLPILNEGHNQSKASTCMDNKSLPTTSTQNNSDTHTSNHSSTTINSSNRKVSSSIQNSEECNEQTKQKPTSTFTQNNIKDQTLLNNEKLTKEVSGKFTNYTSPKTNTKSIKSSSQTKPKSANTNNYHDLRVTKLISAPLSNSTPKLHCNNPPKIHQITIPKKSATIDLTIDLTTSSNENLNDHSPSLDSTISLSKLNPKSKKRFKADLKKPLSHMSSTLSSDENESRMLETVSKNSNIIKSSSKIIPHKKKSSYKGKSKTILISNASQKKDLNDIVLTDENRILPKVNQPQKISSPVKKNKSKTKPLGKSNSSKDLNAHLIKRDIDAVTECKSEPKFAEKSVESTPKKESKKKKTIENSRRVSDRRKKASQNTNFTPSPMHSHEFVKKALMELIVKVRSRVDSYGFFSGPVDPILHQCPDYYEIIDRETEAMDLDTLQKYIEQGKISNIKQFQAHLKRIVYCAQKYNTDKTNFVRTQADLILPLSQHFLQVTKRKIETYYDKMKRKQMIEDEESSIDDSQTRTRNLLEKLSNEELIHELNKIKDKKSFLRESTEDSSHDHSKVKIGHEFDCVENLSQQSSQCSTSDEIRMALEYDSTSQESDSGEYNDPDKSDDESLISFESFEEKKLLTRKRENVSTQINGCGSRRKKSRRKQKKDGNNKDEEKRVLRSRKQKGETNSHQKALGKTKIEKNALEKKMRKKSPIKISQKEPRFRSVLISENDNSNLTKDYFSDNRQPNETLGSDQKNSSMKSKNSTIDVISFSDNPSLMNKKMKTTLNNKKNDISKKTGKTGDRITIPGKKQTNSKVLRKNCVYDDVEEFIDGVDIPHCNKDLSSSLITHCSVRTKWLSLVSEMVIVCNEATRRSTLRKDPSAEFFEKPLSEIYIRERLEYDKPLNGLIVRSQVSPHQLQGFIITTNFITYRQSFRWTVNSPAACLTPTDCRLHATDNGSLTDELQKVSRKGDASSGFVFHRVCEISFLGGLGCGGALLEKTLSGLKEGGNYDYIVLQSTKMAIPFYERYGFVRVGAVNRFQDNERMPEVAYRHWSEIVNGKAVESSYMMARRINDENAKKEISSTIDNGREITESERRIEVISSLNSAKSLLVESFSIRATGSATYTNSYRELFLLAKEFAISAGDRDLHNTIDHAIREITKSTIGLSRVIIKDLLRVKRKREKDNSLQCFTPINNDLKSETKEKVPGVKTKLKVKLKLSDQESFIFDERSLLSVTIPADIVERMPFQKLHENYDYTKCSWKKRTIRIRIVLNGTIVDHNTLDMHNDKSDIETPSTSSNRGLYAKMLMPPMRENLTDLREATAIALDNFLSFILVSTNHEEESSQFLSNQDQMVKPGDNIMLKVPAYDGSDLWIAVEVERHSLKKERPSDKNAKYGNCFILKFNESDGEKRIQRILDSWNRGVGREWCTMMDWHSFPVLPIKVLDALLLNCPVEYPNLEGKCVSGFISKRVGGGLDAGPKWRLRKKTKKTTSLMKDHSDSDEDLEPGALREAIYISDLHMKMAKEILTKTKLVNEILDIDDGRTISSDFETEMQSSKSAYIDSSDSSSDLARDEIINEKSRPLLLSSVNSPANNIEQIMQSQESPTQKASNSKVMIKQIKTQGTASSTTDQNGDWAIRRDLEFNLSSIKNPSKELEFITSHQEDNRFLYKTIVSTKNKSSLSPQESQNITLSHAIASEPISLLQSKTVKDDKKCKLDSTSSTNSISKVRTDEKKGILSECPHSPLPQNGKLDSHVKRKRGRPRKQSQRNKSNMPSSVELDKNTTSPGNADVLDSDAITSTRSKRKYKRNLMEAINKI